MSKDPKTTLTEHHEAQKAARAAEAAERPDIAGLEYMDPVERLTAIRQWQRRRKGR